MSTVTVSSPRLIANGCGAWSDTYNSIEDAMQDLDQFAWNLRNGGADGSMLANLWTLAEYCEEYVQEELADEAFSEYPRGDFDCYYKYAQRFARSVELLAEHGPDATVVVRESEVMHVGFSLDALRTMCEFNLDDPNFSVTVND